MHWIARGLLTAGLVVAAQASQAGDLLIKNISSKAITCVMDDGRSATVDAGATLIVEPVSTVLGSFTCGSLRVNNLYLTADSPDRFIVLNGRQDHVVNVLTYPYLPDLQTREYSNMVLRMISEYMDIDESAILNVVVADSASLDTYNDANWSTLFGSSGFDVLEVDTINLQPMVSQKLLREVSYDAEDMFDFALQSSQVNGRTFAVPSTGCSNVLFGRDSKISAIDTGDELLSYFKSLSSPVKFAGDFSGTTTLGGGYLSAFTDIYGFDERRLQQFVTDPQQYLDQETIDRMAQLFINCEKDGQNLCINGGFDKVFDIDAVFADGTVPTMIGYTERAACNIVLSSQTSDAVAIQLPFGDKQTPLMYTDGFVTNAARCVNDSTCRKRVDSVTRYLASLKTRSWIAQGSDLPSGKPRYILPLYKSFYDSSFAKSNNLYKQFKPVIYRAKPFPNYFAKSYRGPVYSTVCSALQKSLKNLRCLL